MQMLFPNGRKKVLTFSYDDGIKDDIKLAQIFSHYGMKATFNINSGKIIDSNDVRKDPDGYLTWGELKKYCVDSGHEIAVHTLTHPWIESLSLQDALYEIIRDKENIEKNLKCISRGMAYPFGCYSERAFDAIRSAGIVYSRTTKATHSFELPKDALMLHPTCHHNDTELFNLAENFLNDDCRWGKVDMLYVWGHSYEFTRDNNWNSIIKLCELLSKKNEVWYATNIEIFDYVDAYKRLHISYDKKIVFNPSSIPVWINENGVYCVNPGEKLYLD